MKVIYKLKDGSLSSYQAFSIKLLMKMPFIYLYRQGFLIIEISLI